MNDKRAKDIMTTDVIVANKNDIIANVANLLIKEKIGGLPVVDEENKVVGIISETDIEKRIPCGFSKDVKFHTRDNIFR